MTQKDITGQKFGRLTAIKPSFYKGKDWYWLFKCDCGNEKIINKYKVTNGKICSCGCMRKEKITKRNMTHGLFNTKLYGVWRNMKKRCLNPKCKSFIHYGARGIKVCMEWRKDFIPFYKWAMENGYKDGLTIDRIDNDGEYCPENCRWTTQKEQQNNRSNNIKFLYDGEILSIGDVAKKLGMSYGKFYRIYKSGKTKLEVYDYVVGSNTGRK